MKNLGSINKLLLLLSCFVVVVSSVSAQTVPAKEFKKQLKKQKGVLIDVRTPEEYNAERINNAINISIASKNFLQQLDSLDRSKSYFLYCGVGKRSARAAIYMKELDFQKVYDLEGGLTEWKKKYKTIVKN